MAVVFVGLAVVLLSALLVEPSGPSPSEPKVTTITDAMADAWYGCTKAVSNRLKAPATADFPRYSEVSVVATAGRFEVTSYVDSENGFGANIRTPFSCTGTYREATRDWLFHTSLD